MRKSHKTQTVTGHHIRNEWTYNLSVSLHGALFSEIGINMTGCNKLSDCAIVGAKCNAGKCQCDQTDFYNGTQCINSKNF